MKIPLLSFFVAFSLFPAAAFAEDASPDAKTDVRVTSDWPGTELIQHLGTSYGVGTVNGRAASVTTVHLDKLCRVPCTASIATEGSYYVDAPGMHAREFQLPPGTKSVDVRVKGASAFPLGVSSAAMALGLVTAAVGGTLWGIYAATDKGKDTTVFQTTTFIGGGVMLAGIAGLIFFPRTHVEASDGGVLDASAASPKKAGFTGNGWVF